MINAFTKNAHLVGANTRRLIFVCSMLVLISGCGKDEDDGEVRNTVALPTDIVLNLYCDDIGIFTETCALDDPENPYRLTPFATMDPTDEDAFNTAKFDLANAAPSPKAKFYVYATAMARAPTGENQFYTALALHELFTATVTASPPGSALIRDQAIRAYRSVLDNFFDSSTFFPASFVPDPDIFFPVPLAPQAAFYLALSGGEANLFFADIGSNEFFARETMGSWGYTWVGMIERPAPSPPIPGPVFLN